MRRLFLAAALAASCIAAPAQATVIISEDFTIGYGVFAQGGNVTLTNGNALIGCCGATGTPANMSNNIAAFGGGNFPSGALATAPIFFAAGQVYTLTFDYGAFGITLLSDPLTVNVGGATFILNTLANNNFDSNRSTFSVNITGNGQSAPLVFTSAGNANVDAFIDNVSLISTVVPEPATWALMLLGFGGIGVAMRRRRRPLSQVA